MKNKTKSMLIALFMVFSINGFSQSRDGSGGKFTDWVGSYYLNHAKGVKLLSFRAGGTHFSNWGYFAGEYNWYVLDKMYLNFSPVFDKGAIDRTKYFNLTGNVSAAYNIYDLSDRFFLNAHLGLRSGIEKTDNTAYNIQETSFVYGGFGGAEVEAFFGRLGLTFQFQEFYTRGSKLGSWHYSGALGLKYIL